jgi:ABC-type Na+ efflux pump permease subunit
LPVNLAIRIAFNPNVTTAWLASMMGIINSVTMLAIVLAGAAVVREREHGTMDHLLAMPVSPFEIVMSKILANGLVIAIAVGLSVYLVVRVRAAVHGRRCALPVLRNGNRHILGDHRSHHAAARTTVPAGGDPAQHAFREQHAA